MPNNSAPRINRNSKPLSTAVTMMNVRVLTASEEVAPVSGSAEGGGEDDGDVGSDTGEVVVEVGRRLEEGVGDG